MTKEQQAMLDAIASRDGAYSATPTERGMIYHTISGTEILRDEADPQPSEIEQLKARIEALEARR